MTKILLRQRQKIWDRTEGKDTLRRGHMRMEAEMGGCSYRRAWKPKEEGRTLLEPAEEAWAHQP